LNHYPRHIGDYLKKTIGLSMLQDGAYNRMLDLYYGEEGPLPADRGEIYTATRCQGRADREAVDFVLRKFFVEQADGFHHNRCDEELARYAEKSDKAARSASVRWGNSKCERNANASQTHTETHLERIPERNASHNQNHNQEVQERGAIAPPRPKRANGKIATRLPEGWTLPDDWQTWAATVFHVDPQKVFRVSLDFRDYWHAAPGQRGVKADWQATWRRWCRKEFGNA